MRDIQNKTSLIILALNTGSAFEEYCKLIDMGFHYVKEVRGSYKGITEVAHVLSFETLEDLKKALIVAAEHKQDSILVLDVERNAQLYYIGGGIEEIGRLVAVDSETALTADAWTHCAEQDQYYICR